MTKREYILTLLEALGKDREAAKGLKLLIERHLLDDTTVDALITIMKEKVNEVSDLVQKDLLKLEEMMEAS